MHIEPELVINKDVYVICASDVFTCHFKPNYANLSNFKSRSENDEKIDIPTKLDKAL